MEYRDGGYGNIGNLTVYIILSDLTDEEEKKFREDLKKETPKQYEEYIEYENLIQQTNSI